MRAIATETDHVDKRFRAIPAAAAVAQRAIVGMARHSSAALKAFGRTVAVATAAFGAWGISVAAQRDAQQRGLQAMLGSAKEAERVMTRMRAVALQPGVTFDAGLSLATSLMAVKVHADLAVDAVGNFGNALALAGRGEEELQRVGVALSQIVSKGKVSAEEINQLAEAVPQIRDVMMSVFGTADTEKLQRDLAAAGISAKQFVELLVEGFTPGGLVAKATDTFSNKLVNLKAAFRDLAAAFGSAFVTPSGGAALDQFTATIQSLGPAMRQLGQAAAAALPALGRFIKQLLDPSTIAGGAEALAEVMTRLRQVPAHVQSWLTMAGGYVAAFGDLLADIMVAVGIDLSNLVARGSRLIGVGVAAIKAGGQYVADVGRAVIAWLREMFAWMADGARAAQQLGAALSAMASGDIRAMATASAEAVRALAQMSHGALSTSSNLGRAGAAFDAGMAHAADGWAEFQAAATAALAETQEAHTRYQDAQTRFLQAIDRARDAHQAATQARRAEAHAAGQSAKASADAAMAAREERAAQEEVTKAIFAQNTARQRYLDLLEQQRIAQERLLQQAKRTVANSASRAMAAEDRLNARGRGIGAAQAANSFRIIGPMAYREVDRMAGIAGEQLTPQERDKRAIQTASGMFGGVSANTAQYDQAARRADALAEAYRNQAERMPQLKDELTALANTQDLIAEKNRAISAAIEQGFAQQQQRIQQQLERTGQTLDAVMAGMTSLAQAEAEQVRQEEDAARKAAEDAKRDPRRIAVTMSGGGVGPAGAGLNDRLTAGALGNLGLGSEAILAQARMDQQGRIIADATSGAMMPFTRVIVQAIREGIGRATRQASAMTAAAEGAI